jgi:GAF domain-containing protein
VDEAEMEVQDRKAMLAELQDLLLDSPDLRAFLNQLTDLAALRLSRTGTAFCSITLRRHRRGVTFAFSDPEAALWDEVQYGRDDGPCLEAMRTGRIVATADLWAEKRWRSYVDHVQGRGPRSLIAAPISLEGDAAAALNCYSARPDAFGDQDLELASSLAADVSSSVRIALKIAAESELAADLSAALGSRTAINLAAGIVMGQSQCSQEEAMAILIQASNHRNQKLRDVALEIIAAYDPSGPKTRFE